VPALSQVRGSPFLLYRTEQEPGHGASANLKVGIGAIPLKKSVFE